MPMFPTNMRHHMKPQEYNNKYENYIGGEWRSLESSSRTVINSYNPAAKTKLISSVPDSGEHEINEAVGCAKEAQGNWSEMSMGARASLLEALADRAESRQEELGRLVTDSMGKILAEGKGDILFANLSLRYFAAQAREQQGSVYLSAVPGKKTYTLRKPRGVVGIISPWNFPAMIPIGWQAAPALVYGNTIVLKPSEDSPELAAEYAKMAHEVGFPKGVFNVVFGDGPHAGEPLARHPDVNVVLFTGSSMVGKHLRQVTSDPKYCDKLFFGELGGKNGLIISDRGDYATALAASWKSIVATTNQRCVSASKLIVHSKLLPRFADDLAELLELTRIGYGAQPGIDMGPLINQAAVQKYIRHLDYGKEYWSSTLCNGGVLQTGPEYKEGYFVKPSLGIMEFDWKRDIDPSSAASILTEEAFSPVATLVPYDRNVSQALEILNATDYGLSSALISNDINEVNQFEWKAPGIKYINGATVAAEIHLPFVGEKGSNIGGIPGNAGIMAAVTHSTPVSVFSLPNPTLALPEEVAEKVKQMSGS